MATIYRNDRAYIGIDSAAMIHLNDGTVLQNAIDNIIGNTAAVETSPSTAAHSVGSYIVYLGKLYKVTSAIEINDTLTVGTNIAKVNFGEEIADIESDVTKLNNDLTWTNVTGFNVDKFNDMVVKVMGKELYISFNTIQSTFNEDDVLTTLPAIARPATTNVKLLAWNYSSDKVYVLTLNTKGELVCYGKGSISGRLICSSLVLLV